MTLSTCNVNCIHMVNGHCELVEQTGYRKGEEVEDCPFYEERELGPEC